MVRGGFIAGCLAAVVLAVASASARAEGFGRDDIILDPDWRRFSVCHENGCASLSVVALSEAQWNGVLVVLERPAADAAEERERLAWAIALMEQYVGELTGTWRDKGGSYNDLFAPGQMDCHDETINTTNYLALFNRYGLLRHHRIAPPATRGWFLFGLPHATAVIVEVASGERWAVDSWFLDNGKPPYILPLDVWRAGWEPGD